jgi:hypothetical protein
MKRWLLIISCLAMVAVWCFPQTSRLTSDASQSPPAAFPPFPGIYQPPQPSICIVWTTNVEPLVVRTTISSNVMPRWVWIDQGRVHTNYGAPLSSNVVSVTTNEVTR